MVSGSAALPASIHEEWFRWTGQKLLERYGMTEIGMALSNPFHGERRPGTVGQPLPGAEVRLMAENGQLITGVISPERFRSAAAGCFANIRNRPEITAESFVDGWFKTGDMGVVEGGYYRILGRLSVDIIKSGGYKLSALEIEAVVVSIPPLRSAPWSACQTTLGEKKWPPWRALRPEGKLDLPTLRDWCRERISPYKIPKRLLAVASLPDAMGRYEARGAGAACPKRLTADQRTTPWAAMLRDRRQRMVAVSNTNCPPPASTRSHAQADPIFAFKAFPPKPS